MNKVTDFFRNKIVISIVGLLILSFLLWFAGPLIKFGDSNTAPLGSVISRLTVILVLVVLWGLNNLRIQWMSKKHNAELLNDLESGRESASADASSEEIQLINQRFTEALSTLRRYKFKGWGSSKALYELPWYIVIGPPGSGKTTALVNSSLDFPLTEQFGKVALQGIGGTRNCDWWFTNEAVLIDTAGRYTTQDSHKIVDSTAWDGFLKLLKKYRRRRPINGAIVAISIHDLLIQTEEERIQHARIIRSRIDELMDKLEVRFPVYLMFTKADLISGFEQYFEDLGKEDREQVWGISLPDAARPSQGPDFEFLNVEYRKLLERLYERELSRMHSERDIRRRAYIQGFPQQFENLASVISSFVQQCFMQNRFRYQPYLRGMYFTSGTQDGTPIDRMMTAVSSSFGFARENVQPQHAQGKTYFLGNLFREVIFPESELVGTNRKYEIFFKWMRRSAYVGMALLAVGMLVIWTGSVKRYAAHVAEVESFIKEYNAENKRLNLWSKDVRVVLPALNALAKASVVYDQDSRPWLSGLGLYDNDVDESADDAYHAQLKELLLPRIIDYLEKHIQKGYKGGDLYHSFRTYMMFSKVEHMDKQLVSDWFASDWIVSMQGEATNRKELEMHLKALLSLDLQPYQLDTRLIQQTRNLLLRDPVEKRIYSRIRTSPEFSQKINVLNLFGGAVRDAYVINPEIEEALQLPYMFTKEAYDKMDLSAESPVIADAVNERWVLSDDESAKVDFVKEDLNEISEKVKSLYMADYIAHWEKILDVLNVAEFKSIKQAGEIVASFTDPVYSPLLSILQVSSVNTQLSSQLLQKLDDGQAKGIAGSATSYLADKFKGTKVDQRFRDLNLLLRESANKPAPIASILQKLQQIQEFIGEITVSPDPNMKAFEVAKARYLAGAGNAITSLRTFSKTTPEPIKRWLDSIADGVWKTILSSAKWHINNEWKKQVYSVYREGLSDRYPIKRSATDEIALYDFSEFFKPNGIVDAFFSSYIKPFINTGKSWSNRVIDNYSLGLSETALEQVNNAQTIKSIFFSENPSSPGFSFQLKPDQMNKIDAHFQIEVGDQRVGYNHGPKFWKEMKWSGEDENKTVRIIFEDLSENLHENSFYGPWAWFKLQDKSRLTKTKQSNVYLMTFHVNERRSDDTRVDHYAKYFIKAKSVNNPFNENLIGTFKCPGSI
jgi:type VI secretion system protein ImpL